MNFNVLNKFIKNKWVGKIGVALCLVLIFLVAFSLRTYFAYPKFASQEVLGYTDDAMYHMRLLENLLLGGHFPKTITFDPFTNFPLGTYHKVAPLFDLVLATIIWLISFGKPTLKIINTVAPFYPVVLAGLIPIVVYFIAKALWKSTKISLVSSFLSAISVPILYKSAFASNDHHVMEVLLSSMVVMFLIYALTAMSKADAKQNKKFWIYVFLSSLFMGLYVLAWTGAILFLFIISVFVGLYYLIEFISGRDAKYILQTGLIIFVIPFSMVLPLLGRPDFSQATYGINHLLCFVLGFLGFLALYFAGIIVKNRKWKKWTIIPFLAIIFVLLLTMTAVILPNVFSKIVVLSAGINNNGMATTNFKDFVGEMRPMKFKGAMSNFSTLFFFFLTGFFIILFQYLKNKKPEYLFLIIWSAVNFLIVGVIPFFGQIRFFIYFAINVVLLTGFMIVKGFEFGFKSLEISSRLEKNNSDRIYFLTGSVVILFAILFFVLFPIPLTMGDEHPMPDSIAGPLQVAQQVGPFNKDWLDTMLWLKNNTPDPGLDYYALYKGANPYPYPKEAYGVLSVWDYGHAIVYYAHRFAIANNFQQGIGRIENGKVTQLGEGVFFLETDEAKATSYLDQLKAKYVITDARFATLSSSNFSGMVELVQGNLDGYIENSESATTKYDNSMIARLTLLDGTENIIKKKVDNKDITLTISPLSHFRLLYESSIDGLTYTDKNLPIKEAKIFEYVKGVTIKGFAYPGAEVKISTKVKTNQGREFVYEKHLKTNDGSFEFLVPYSTGKQENSDTFAEAYTLSIGGYVKKVKVLEEDVLQGKTIKP